MKIRNAYPQEAEQLTRLALRSKSYWGYDDSFMLACKSALTVERQNLESDSSLFQVYILNNAIVGFYGLEFKNNTAELDYLFVEPEAMGKGVGKYLLNHAIKSLKSRGIALLEILSDPGAKAFYLACGAEYVGLRNSDAIKGRQLPYLKLMVSESTLA